MTDQHDVSNQNCDQDTFKVIQEQMNSRQDYITLMGKIEDAGYEYLDRDTDTNIYIVLEDKDLHVMFQRICEESGGQMVSADVVYYTDTDTDTQDHSERPRWCSADNDNLVNYSGYPICVAKSKSKSCEEDRSRSHTLLGVLKQNLDIVSMECEPEITFYTELDPLPSIRIRNVQYQ